jgi:flagellar motility protein MotE (MotC chaperone)
MDKKEKNTKQNRAKIVVFFLSILKYFGISLTILIVLGTIAYLTLANLAFWGLLPSKITNKLPIIHDLVKNIKEKEKLIQLEREILEDQKKIQKSGELQIDIMEVTEIEGESQKPELYKLRVYKNNINNKETSELWIDNTLVINFYVEVDNTSPYTRATNIVRNLSRLINEDTNFNELLPVIDRNNHKAQIKEIELFKVSPEDAILHNTTQLELLYTWVNNIRVALGASLFQVPKFIVRESDIKDSDIEEKDIKEEEIVNNKKIEEEQRKKREEEIAQLKKVVRVYERIPDDKVIKILNRMNIKDIADIYTYMSIKKISKVFPLMPISRDLSVYRRMISTGEEDNKSKMFKKFSQIWEKIPDNELTAILLRMTQNEKLEILRKMSDKKKAKVFELMPITEATKYLQLLENP